MFANFRQPFYLTEEWFSWVKRPFLLSVHPDLMPGRPLQLTNNSERAPAYLAVSYFSLRHRESYFLTIAILRRDKEAYFLEIVSDHPQSQLKLFSEAGFDFNVWSANVIIGRMVKCRNWTDVQMSESDPEAIRGIRASPSAPPHIGPKLLQQPWSWWQIGTDQVLLEGEVLNRGLRAM